MRRHRLSFLLLSLLIAFIFFGLARLYYRLTDDFRLSNMTYHEAIDYEWVDPPLSTEDLQQLIQVLQQKFYYIGKGAQCYAFVSQDQNYVLKFFKFKHLRPSWYIAWLPSLFPFKDYKIEIEKKKKRKLEGIFQGYDVAYKENKKGSELLYLHLMPTHYLKQQVSVIDKIGFEHTINLDDVVFLLQRKGETLRNRMNRLLKDNRIEESKHSLADIIAMYMKEYKKGLYDRDHGVMHNTGFVEDLPFHLDVGKFTKDDRMTLVEFYKKDLEHIVWKIDIWIKNNYPMYYPTLSSYLAEQYQIYTGEPFNVSLIDSQKFKKRRH